MSPLFSRAWAWLLAPRLFIGLQPQRIVLRREGGLGRHPRLQQVLELGAGSSPEALLDALERELQDARWHGARACVTVSNALVGYALVPASTQALAGADELALAQLKLRQMHGAPRGDAAAREVRLGQLLGGRDQVAAALDGAFMARLRGVLKQANLRVCSVQPYLMRAFNQVRAQLAGDAFWFALAEPGALLLGCWQRGHWVFLQVERTRGPLERALSAQLLQARLLAERGGDTRRVYLLAPGMATEGCSAGPDAELVLLRAPRERELLGTTTLPALAALGGRP